MNDGPDTQFDSSPASVGGSNPLARRTLRIASFNVENYLDDPAPNGRGKSTESKTEVRKSICAINPDVLALQPGADEAELRLAEARLLREKIDALLAAAPQTRLVVLGDFNDTQDSAVIRTLIGQSPHRLTDTRPAEGNGQAFVKPNDPGALRTVAWTNYHPKGDFYTRIDYLLISRKLASDWLPGESYVLASPNWGIASDHRPVVAAFRTQEGVL